MITAVWGIDFVKPEGVINGFAVHESFTQYGFQDGDKITKFNGEEPLDVTDINKYLFLRDLHSLDVIHANGTTETLDLPENIGDIMWESGVLQPFQTRSLAVIDKVVTNSPAEIAGFLKKDKILSVDNTPVNYWHEFTKLVVNSEGSISIAIERDGVAQTISLTPGDDNKIGVAPKTSEALDIQHKDYSFMESISKGNSLAIWTLKDYITQFKYVFTKKEQPV